MGHIHSDSEYDYAASAEISHKQIVLKLNSMQKIASGENEHERLQ